MNTFNELPTTTRRGGQQRERATGTRLGINRCAGIHQARPVESFAGRSQVATGFIVEKLEVSAELSAPIHKTGYEPVEEYRQVPTPIAFHSRAPLPQRLQRASGLYAAGLAPNTKGSAALPVPNTENGLGRLFSKHWVPREIRPLATVSNAGTIYTSAKAQDCPMHRTEAGGRVLIYENH